MYLWSKNDSISNAFLSMHETIDLTWRCRTTPGYSRVPEHAATWGSIIASMTLNGPIDACFLYARSLSSVDVPMRVRRRCAVVRKYQDSKVDDGRLHFLVPARWYSFAHGLQCRDDGYVTRKRHRDGRTCGRRLATLLSKPEGK